VRVRVALRYHGTVSELDGATKSTGTFWRVVQTLFVAAAAALGATFATCAYHALGPKAAKSNSVTTVRASPPIVVAIRDLATLEAATYHMERVIDLRDSQSHLFGLFESEDAVLLVAAADVVAGVDLTTMRDGDVRFDWEQRTAEILLPPPIVLSARLDNDRTYVHTRSTDTLARRAETLETRARREAEQTLRDAAITAGILGRARENAARTVKTLVESLGYDQVEVRFREE
jgi:hypothetical protein